MPKFFNEVWLRDMSPKTMQGVVDFLGKLRVGVRPHNLPGDLQLLAGPWLSNEEAKVYSSSRSTIPPKRLRLSLNAWRTDCSSNAG